jgi:hypothetical protein
MHTAYTTLNNLTPATEVFSAASVDLGAVPPLAPGVYKFTGSAATIGTGETLHLAGYPGGVYVFQIPGTFTVLTGAQVVLSGGQEADNVYWVVGGATELQANSIVNGTILDNTGVTLDNEAALNGAAMSYTASVTLNKSVVTLPAALDEYGYGYGYVAPPIYTLTYTAGAGGTISGTSPQTVVYETSGSAVTAVPNSGYQFTSWSDGVTTASRTDTNVMGNVTVTANFSAVSNNNNNNNNGNGGGGGGGGGSYTSPYTVLINGGAPATVSPIVNLTLTTIAGSNMMWISNDPSFTAGTGTGWIPFQSTYPWTLASTSGGAEVYVEFGSGTPTASVGNAVASITVGSGGSSGTSFTTGGGTSGVLGGLQTQLLNLLIAELQTLLRQAQAQGMTLTPGEAAYLNMGSTMPTLSALTTDLTVGSRGANVTALQLFLIAQAKGSAASALSAAGATGYFGSLTKAALAEYQLAAGITPPAGYFGSITRAYLKGIGY